MEEHYFPDPAVARILGEHYVEARLHTDGSKNIDQILEMQRRLARTQATPTYVILDPNTETEIHRHEGGFLGVDGVAEFLRHAVDKWAQAARR